MFRIVGCGSSKKSSLEFASFAVTAYRKKIIFSGIDRRAGDCFIRTFSAMKVVSSLKSLKHRHPDCQVVRRKGRVYVINKTNPRFKARQG